MATTNQLIEFGRWAHGWLFESALPLWWQVGADREGGGFHEKIDQDGTPVLVAKRIRVQARQVFVYSEAGRLGWDGPWREAIDHGLSFLLSAYKRDDGLFRTAVAGGAQPGSDDVVLYDQAFVLLALAAGYRATGREALLGEGQALLARLEERLGHPIGGFQEADPPRLPLLSNPHMHMLEANLAWAALDVDPRFAAKAREIAELARDRLIDPESGAIGEYYDGDWRLTAPPKGRIREPGHQFEWAFLLDRAATMLGTDTRAASRGLLAFGEGKGVRDGLARFEIDADGGMVDGSARLWAQSERLRALALLAGPEAERGVDESIAALRHYLDVPVAGLWTDRVTDTGEWQIEPAPASSLYHLVTAITPLIEGQAG